MSLEGVPFFVTWKSMHPASMIGCYLGMNFAWVKRIDESHLFPCSRGKVVGSRERELSCVFRTARQARVRFVN